MVNFPQDMGFLPQNPLAFTIQMLKSGGGCIMSYPLTLLIHYSKSVRFYSTRDLDPLGYE